MDSLYRPGEVTEITGLLSSGRTSLLVECLAEVTGAGAAAALVDADGAFDPASAARAGVDLGRLLWVRCEGRRDRALAATDLLVRCPGFALVALDLGETVPPLPPAAAFRWRLVVRRTDVALVLLGRRRATGSGASLAVETTQRAVEWAGSGADVTRLVRVRAAVAVVRARGSGAGASRAAVWCA